jgi:regulatory protein
MYSSKASVHFSAQQSALYLLSQRDYGSYELAIKLQSKGYLAEDIALAIEYCSENNYLDDRRYAQSQVRQHIYKGHGENRIRQALTANRVERELIAEALDTEQTDWFELAKSVAEKKYRNGPAGDQKEHAKRVRFLQYRGFSYDQISYALESCA